MILTA